MPPRLPVKPQSRQSLVAEGNIISTAIQPDFTDSLFISRTLMTPSSSVPLPFFYRMDGKS